MWCTVQQRGGTPASAPGVDMGVALAKFVAAGGTHEQGFASPDSLMTARRYLQALAGEAAEQQLRLARVAAAGAAAASGPQAGELQRVACGRRQAALQTLDALACPGSCQSADARLHAKQRAVEVRFELAARGGQRDKCGPIEVRWAPRLAVDWPAFVALVDVVRLATEVGVYARPGGQIPGLVAVGGPHQQCADRALALAQRRLDAVEAAVGQLLVAALPGPACGCGAAVVAGSRGKQAMVAELVVALKDHVRTHADAQAWREWGARQRAELVAMVREPGGDLERLLSPRGFRRAYRP